ncbi:MAG: hypothetical protein KF789_08105 [Bdellovibrionaceae bacterium]|nr:hypothetical protein [Pseudobdellovibrionaceae bacterium]
MKKALGMTLALCLATTVAQAQENSLTTSAPAKAKRSGFRNYSGEASFGMLGREFGGDVVNARFSRASISGLFNFEFTDWLQAKLEATQTFTSGATSNLYSAPEGGSGSNGLGLDEASLTLKPIDKVTLKGGILPVGANPVFSLMAPGSWAAYSVGARQKIGSFTLGLDGAQGIPTARSTSNRIVDEDTLPLYTSGTLLGELKTQSGFIAKAAATRFIFTDLSAQSAQDSQQIGSTVVGNSRSAFLFAYEYRGMEYALELKQVLFNEDEIGIKGSFAENDSAPEGMNQGGKVALRYMRAGDNWNSAVTLTRFNIESDVMPATYTSSGFSFTNRQGNSIALKFDNKKHNFGLLGSYSKSDVLNRDAQAARFQGDNEIITIGGEVTHDLF